MDSEEGMARQGEFRVAVHDPEKYAEDRWINMMEDKIMLQIKGLNLRSRLQDDKEESKISKLTLREEISQSSSQLRSETAEGFSQPRVVTIGPFHNKQNNMKISDDNKRMLVLFLTLLYNLELEDCIKKVKIQEEKARQRYPITAADDGFAEMLLLDSYFILFVLTIKIRLSPSGYTLIPLASSSLGTYLKQVRDERTKVLDILCHKDEIVPDLLILDNQIPFFVIDELFKTLLRQDIDKPLHKYALEFFETIHPKSTQGYMDQNSPPEFFHLLHLFHWSRVPQNKYIIPSSSPEQLDNVEWPRLHIPNAMELRESATMFEKKMSGSSLYIKFRGRRFTPIVRVFDIPELHIRDYSSIIFHNLIAFEMQSSKRGCCTMAFSTLMGNLLQSEEDVKLLQRKGILVSSSMDNNKLIYLFKSLSRLTENYQMPRDLFVTLQQVRSHHESMVSQFCGSIILQYFPNPLVTLSVAAAAMIFVLTLLQTIYTMISYYQHP